MSDDLTTNALGTKDGTSVVTPQSALKEAVERVTLFADLETQLTQIEGSPEYAYERRIAELEHTLEAMASAGEPFAFYYDVNDLHERSNEDAIEVPVGDLRRVTTTLSQYRKTGDL